jgi:hypothetical protein
MIGFLITMSNGSLTSVEADSYAVDDTGDLCVSGGDSKILECRADEWVVITTLGTRLASEWPPDDLDVLVSSVAYVLGVRFGHYVHELRKAERFQGWRMNDMESLAAALLAAADIDATDSTRREEALAVGRLVTSHFDL